MGMRRTSHGPLLTRCDGSVHGTGLGIPGAVGERASRGKGWDSQAVAGAAWVRAWEACAPDSELLETLTSELVQVLISAATAIWCLPYVVWPQPLQ